MENGCGGRSLSLSFRMESTTDGSRIPRLAEFARIKTNSSGLITPKAGWSIRLSQSKVVWWTRPGSNRRPPRCERGGKIHKAWCCNHLRLLKVALNGQLGQPGQIVVSAPKGEGNSRSKGAKSGRGEYAMHPLSFKRNSSLKELKRALEASYVCIPSVSSNRGPDTYRMRNC